MRRFDLLRWGRLPPEDAAICAADTNCLQLPLVQRGQEYPVAIDARRRMAGWERYFPDHVRGRPKVDGWLSIVRDGTPVRPAKLRPVRGSAIESWHAQQGEQGEACHRLEAECGGKHVEWCH